MALILYFLYTITIYIAIFYQHTKEFNLKNIEYTF